MKSPRIAAIALTGVLLAAAAPATAQTVTISGINFAPDHVFYGKPLVEYAKMVNDANAGLKIDLKPYGSIGMFEIGNAVKNGVVDLANLPPTFMKNIVPVAEIIKLSNLPMKTLDANGTWDLFNKVLNEKGNIQLIKAWGDGVNFHIYLRDKKIDQADLTGLKLRVSPVFSAGFAKLGASPVNMPFSELYTALERNAIDGYGITLSDIVTWGWSKFTKYRVDPGFYEVWSTFIVNKNTWDKLTPAHQKLLMDKADELYDIVNKRVKAQNAKDIREQKEAGMQVIQFTGAKADKLLSTMYDAAWEEMAQKDSVNTPKFRKLITDGNYKPPQCPPDCR